MPYPAAGADGSAVQVMEARREMEQVSDVARRLREVRAV